MVPLLDKLIENRKRREIMTLTTSTMPWTKGKNAGKNPSRN